MRIEKARVYVPEGQLDPAVMKRLERYARICYKSEDKMDGESGGFVGSLLKRGHASVIEHEKITVLMVTDRGVTHEVVRHRIGSFSQESTRYCNYSQDRFGREISVIEPVFFRGSNRYELWERGCREAEKAYFELLDAGASPQEARSVLPNSLKTEIAVTFNMRQWRHFFELRCHRTAHPQAREISIPLLRLFASRFPELFGDLDYDREFPAEYEARVILSNELFVPLEEIHE